MNNALIHKLLEEIYKDKKGFYKHDNTCFVIEDEQSNGPNVAYNYDEPLFTGRVFENGVELEGKAANQKAFDIKKYKEELYFRNALKDLQRDIDYDIIKAIDIIKGKQ